jgi:hypothetical protein
MIISGFDIMKLINGEWITLLYIPLKLTDDEESIAYTQNEIMELCTRDKTFCLKIKDESIIVHVKPGDVFKVKRVYM